jgi:aspartate beta-hydroxylase
MNAAEQGHLLLKQGKAREAEVEFRRVLEDEPDHVEALNVVGLAALRDGDIDSALALLKRAIAADGGQALTHLHLGRAHTAAFEFEAATAAYEMALAREPKLHIARLHLAELHEKRGETMRAVMMFARALNGAQAEGRWLNAATTPAALLTAVNHAQQFVRERRLAGFAELMEPFVKQYGRGALRRVEQAVRIHLYLEQPAFPDPRQKPTFLFFPGLPATPYLDKGLIPQIEDLEAHTDEIRAELLALLPGAAGRERVFHAGELEWLLLLSPRRAARRQLRGLPDHGGGARCLAALAGARTRSRSTVFGFLSRHAFAAPLWRHEHTRRGAPAALDPRRLRAARGW